MNDIRTFETGATRDTEAGKVDYEGHLSPLALESFCAYMDHHRSMANGGLRDSDNWQRGMPLTVYIKSMFRHFMAVWKIHRGWAVGDIEQDLCALMFNVQGYLHEYLKARRDRESGADFFEEGHPSEAGVDVELPHCDRTGDNTCYVSSEECDKMDWGRGSCKTEG